MTAKRQTRAKEGPQASEAATGAENTQTPSAAPPMKRTAWVRYATPLGSAEVTGARMVPVSLAAEPWRVECGDAP
jgi:hypothetical protein